ncbi:hypothetical protein HMPREF9073_02748 [Capnocytophaga sp. oral taxon 326 str. F0382]|nr:hypothetical protein HMPREF9073_02748 [Capnocytophaga sp. oral taxon 326 str. F0382]
MFSGNYHCNIFYLCKFRAKVQNYYEIRIINEGNCSIFLIFSEEDSVFFCKKSVLQNE